MPAAAYDATLDLTWLAGDGGVARSRLTATGRVYLRRLRDEAHVHTSPRTLSGTIVELTASETALIRLQQSRAHTAPSFEIRFESYQEMVDLRLVRHAEVAVVVDEEETTDGTGQRRGRLPVPSPRRAAAGTSRRHLTVARPARAMAKSACHVADLRRSTADGRLI